jgi:16S rRNA (guanine966-N2)-methyltransferase
MKNQLRIIGGQFKRRQLSFASLEGLRPTPDRVRETLFNWLMWQIEGARVLDVCAGSGALSFEALSRGAQQVLMIEPHPTQVQYLQQNLQLLQISNAEIIASPAQQALHHCQRQFDVVFLDPPYSLNLWQTLAALVEPLLSPDAVIYVEADRDFSLIHLPSSWQLSKLCKAGKVYAGLFRHVTP